MRDAWYTLGTPAPLQTRWDEAAAKMIAAGQVPITPVLEISVHRMNQWLCANPPKTEWQPPSPAEKIAIEQLGIALKLHAGLVTKILDEQRIAGRATIKERAAALGISLSEADMVKPTALRIGAADYHTVAETRAVTAQVNNLANALQSQLTRIEAVSRLEKLDIDTVIFALGSRIGALESRIDYLEQQLEQKPTPKRKAAS